MEACWSLGAAWFSVGFPWVFRGCPPNIYVSFTFWTTLDGEWSVIWLRMVGVGWLIDCK